MAKLSLGDKKKGWRSMAEFPAWGIHVSNTSVRGVKIEDVNGDLQVVAHDQIDYVEDIEDLSSLENAGAMLHALAVFQKKHDMNRCRVFVSVDSATAFNRFVTAPVVQGEELMRILAYEGQQHIPFDLETVFWDHKVLDVRQEEGEVDVLLFAIKKDVVEERLRRLEKVRFPVDGVQLTPVALYNLAVAERLTQSGQLIASVDCDRIDLLLCHGKKLWFRTLPTGFHPMFAEVCEAYDVRHRAAVKIVSGDLPVDDDRPLRQIRRNEAVRLTKEIARMAAYFGGAIEGVKLESILLVPGSPQAPPLQKLLAKETGLEVNVMKSFRHLPVAMPELSPNLAGLAHPTGLALQGLGRSDIDIKLYPQDLERIIAGRRFFHVLSVLVCFITVASMWMMLDSAGSEVAKRQDSLTESVQVMDKLKKEFNSGREESELKDEIVPFHQAGLHRVAIVEGVSGILETIAATNAKNPGLNLVVSLLETKIDSGRDANEVSQTARRIELILGSVDLNNRDEVLKQINDMLFATLGKDQRFSQFSVDGDYLSEQASAKPTPDIEKRTLRRRFRMFKTSFFYDGAKSAEGEN
ncbi:MAG: type IV pilus assembly protein PilM [Planctomycetota bacterium]|jgi:type IV pilus assembly protein PilM